jgi:hypothetical protein
MSICVTNARKEDTVDRSNNKDDECAATGETKSKVRSHEAKREIR